jgi:hypothetical protein
MSMSYERLIVFQVEFRSAFNAVGVKLSTVIGASSLIYAAIAYYSFDEEFYMQSIIDSYAEFEESLLWWLEDIYSELYNLFDHIRAYHRGNHFKEVFYDPEDGSLYVASDKGSVLSGDF